MLFRFGFVFLFSAALIFAQSEGSAPPAAAKVTLPATQSAPPPESAPAPLAQPQTASPAAESPAAQTAQAPPPPATPPVAPKPAATKPPAAKPDKNEASGHKPYVFGAHDVVLIHIYNQP